MPQPNEFFEHIPEVIKQASQSKLGIAALLAIIVGCLAWGFFRKAPIRIRIAIWLLIFGGTVAFYAESVEKAVEIGVDKSVIVSGTVVESPSNDPIKLAQISLVGRPETAVSDDNGNFMLKIVGEGKGQLDLRLRVRHDNYEPYDSQISAPGPALLVPLHHIHSN